MDYGKANTDFGVKRLLGWTGFFLLLLTSMSGIVWYYAYTKDFFFSEIKDMTREMAGYDLAKSDPLSFSLFPRPTLTVNNLKISNPRLARYERIAEVGEMSVILHWSALLRLQLDLDLVLAAPKLSLDVDKDGARNWMTPELEKVTGDLPFDVVRIDTAELALMFRNHQANEILGLDIHQFDINLREGGGSARIETAGRLGESRFFLLGEVAGQGTGNRFTVNLDFGAGRARETRVDAVRAPSVSWWIRQNAVLFPLQGAVKGEIELKEQLPWGELSVELATAKLDEFLHFSEDRLTLKSDIGPLQASGWISLRGSDIDVRDLEANIRQPEIGLEVKGHVSNLLSVIESGLTLKSRSDNLNSIIDTAASFPGLGTRLARVPLETELNATIKSKATDLALEDVTVKLRQGTLSTTLTGRISVTEDSLEYSADLQAGAPDASDLSRILDIEEPKYPGPGPMRITASLSGTKDRLDIADARINLHDGNYKFASKGAIDLSGKVPQLDVQCDLEVVDALGLRTYLSELPEPLLKALSVSLSGNLKGPADDFDLQGITLKMAHEDKRLFAEGSLSGLPGDPDMALDFHYSLEGAFPLDKYFPQLGPQRLKGPLELSGNAAFGDKHLVLDELELKAKDTDVGGLIDIDFSKSPARIVVLMNASEFKTGLVAAESDTRDRKASSDMEGEAPANDNTAEHPPPVTPAKSPGELFQEFTNAIEINTKWVNDLDFYLSFTAERAKLGEYDIEALDVIVDARDGVFTVANYQITLGGRPMRLTGYVNANTAPPTYMFAGVMEGETLEALLNLEEQIVEGGELSGEFVLFSKGTTLGDLIRHLEGQALVEMGPVVIRSRALDFVSSDILNSMLGGITRAKEERQSTRYECGVLGVDVKRGIAQVNKSFALQARDYNLAGKGKIDLNTGYVELAVRPRAKKGLGISLSSVIGGFSVEGHIATPKFGLAGGGLVSAAVLGYALTPTMAAAAANPVTASIVATGFVAKGIFDRLTASSYSCEKTLERIERTRQREINPRSPHSGKMDP